jgi:hypothetical protein
MLHTVDDAPATRAFLAAWFERESIPHGRSNVKSQILGAVLLIAARYFVLSAIPALGDSASRAAASTAVDASRADGHATPLRAGRRVSWWQVEDLAPAGCHHAGD